MSVGIGISLLVTIMLPRTLDYPYVDSTIPLPTKEGEETVGEEVAEEKAGEKDSMIPKAEAHVIVMDRNLLAQNGEKNAERENSEFSVE
jgi:hypothetical protein